MSPLLPPSLHCCVRPAAVLGPEIAWAAGIFPGNQVHFVFVSCQKPKLVKHTERSWLVSEKVNRKLAGEKEGGYKVDQRQ